MLLASYQQWGLNFIDHLEGMWAFALLDQKKGTLILSRDRFGEKPLYTWLKDGTLYFASEIKILSAMVGERPSVNVNHLRRYLVNGYKSLGKVGQTYFNDIQEFPAAGIALLNAPSKLEPTPYWKLRTDITQVSAEDATAHAKELLTKAVELRMRADVPLAFCLSGGIDSATLAAIAAREMGQNIHCFSIIDSDERYNEHENIDTMVAALNCRHHTVHTSVSYTHLTLPTKRIV